MIHLEDVLNTERLLSWLRHMGRRARELASRKGEDDATDHPPVYGDGYDAGRG